MDSNGSRVILHGERSVPRASLSRLVEQLLHPLVSRLSVTVDPDVPYWRERGWTRHGNEWRGTYVVNGVKYEGRAVSDSSGFEFFISRPPRYAKGVACFVDQRDGEYFVHLRGGPAPDLSAGISAVEYELLFRPHA